MNPEEDSNKTLCNAFKLFGVKWLPTSVKTLLLYLLKNPTSSVEGNILFLNFEDKKIFVQLLTVITARGEIIAEKPETIFYNKWNSEHELFCFIQEKIISYADDLNIINEGLWNIDQVFLLINDEPSVNFTDIIQKIFSTVPIALLCQNQQREIEKIAENYHGPTFNSVLVIYPKQFYIEKRQPDSGTAQLELIPFITELLALDITRRYKIFSFKAESEYNLSGQKHLLQLKIFEKPFSNSMPEEKTGLKPVLEEISKIDNNQVINIYLNLPLARLEVDYSILSASDSIMQELQKQQQSGYDFIKDSQLVNSQLISDFGLHLQQGDTMTVSDQHFIKTVYYRALTLLSILSGKK